MNFNTDLEYLQIFPLIIEVDIRDLCDLPFSFEYYVCVNGEKYNDMWFDNEKDALHYQADVVYELCENFPYAIIHCQ
jgi:hypothetical protein